MPITLSAILDFSRKRYPLFFTDVALQKLKQTRDRKCLPYRRTLLGVYTLQRPELAATLITAILAAIVGRFHDQ